MVRLHNLTLKSKRVPTRKRRKSLSIAEYVIVTCAECSTELAMMQPYDGQPVLCAEHERHPTRYEVGEDVIAFEDEP